MTKAWIFRANKTQFCKYFEAGTKYPCFKIKMYSTQCKCAYFSLIRSNNYSGKNKTKNKTKHERLFYSCFTRIYKSMYKLFAVCIKSQTFNYLVSENRLSGVLSAEKL